MPNITPFFWFQSSIQQAVDFYVATFPNSRIVKTTLYGPNMPIPEGEPLIIEFDLDGKRFVALNGGANDAFNNSVSFVINCKDQAEVDHYWNAFLASGGKEIQCGWIMDGFGLRWQVVPDRFFQLINSPDKAANQRVMQAMMKMKKMIIADLEAAAAAR